MCCCSSDDFLLNVGGSVWTLDWCPRLHENAGNDVKCEYLAIAAHPNAADYHKIGEQLSGRGFIQIWCFLHLGDKEDLLNLGVQHCRDEGNLHGYKGAYDHGGNDFERPRRRRGRPRKILAPKSRGRPRKHPISSSELCTVTQGVSGLNGQEDILPCIGTSTQEGCSQFHIYDSESSVLLNHGDDCHEFISVIERPVQENSSISKGIALPRLVLALAHNGKVAWDMKWRPDIANLNGKHHLGYLAVVLGDGSLEVWEVPVHSLVKHLYVACHTEGTDPRFLKLQPVFRCSRINFGDRQSIPLALEWSPSASRNLILAGCHDGTVALWKFSSQLSSQDTKPLLCFTADKVPIRSLAWAPEDSDTECSNLIVTAGHEGLKFWDLRDPYHPLWDLSPVQRAVLGLDWLKEPRCIVIAYEDGIMRTVSLTRMANDTPVTGEPFTRTNSHGVHGQVCSMFAIWSVQVSRDTGLAAYCCSDGSARYFQLTTKAIDKDASRHRQPHFLCGSFNGKGQTLVINTPLSCTPLPKLVSKKVSSSAPALCWRDDEEISNNKNEKMAEGKAFASFPSKSVAVHKVRWNPNKGSGRWLCYGGAAGIVRCQVISP